jgi:hypothetical protein
MDSGEVKANTGSAAIEMKHSEGFSFVITLYNVTRGIENHAKLLFKSTLRDRPLKYFVVVYFMLCIVLSIKVQSYEMKL